MMTAIGRGINQHLAAYWFHVLEIFLRYCLCIRDNVEVDIVTRSSDHLSYQPIKLNYSMNWKGGVWLFSIRR